MEAAHYLIALGSNQRHVRFGSPTTILRAAILAMADAGLDVRTVSPMVTSAPLGPSRRRYANAAALIATHLEPPALLARLQRIEAAFGRVRRGARWGARTLDLDIILWSGGAWSDERLTVPHIAFRDRNFVLGPAAAIAPNWRDPLSRLTIRQLGARASRRSPSLDQPRAAP